MAIEHVDLGWSGFYPGGSAWPRRTMSLWSWQPTLESACVARRVRKLHAAETSHWQSSGSVAANHGRSQWEFPIRTIGYYWENPKTGNFHGHIIGPSWRPAFAKKEITTIDAQFRQGLLQELEFQGWLKHMDCSWNNWRQISKGQESCPLLKDVSWSGSKGRNTLDAQRLNVPGCCAVPSLAMAEKPTDEIPWFVSTPSTSISAEIWVTNEQK